MTVKVKGIGIKRDDRDKGAVRGVPHRSKCKKRKPARFGQKDSKGMKPLLIKVDAPHYVPCGSQDLQEFDHNPTGY